MIELLKKLLESKFNYKLGDYAIYEIHRGKSKITLVTTILFLFSLILYVLEIFEIFESFMSLGILILLLAVLIVAPYTLVKSKFEAIIVTPKYLIQRVSKREFVVIDFDKITDFKISDEGIIIKEDKKRLLLSTDLFQEEVEPIIEILEAKGKTFDKTKDFMIRRINIVINDNVVSIEDDEKITESEKLYEKFHGEFPILTPGFIEEINFRNTMIDDIMYDKGNVFMYLNSVEVRDGHPENTTFDAIQAKDCIMIIEKMKFKSFYQKNLNDKTEPKRDLVLNTEEAIEYLANAVINEWKNNGKKMVMSFASGVHMLHSEFTYDEIIVGWKKAK